MICLRDVVYVAGDEKQNMQIHKVMEKVYMVDVLYRYRQGIANGHNQKLNALEYHSSEVNIAATDMILLLVRRCERRFYI